MIKTEDNRPASAPRAASGLWSVTEHNCTTSYDWHAFQLCIRKESDVLTVGRPERVGSVIGSFYPNQPIRVETADKERGSVGSLKRNDDCSPIRGYCRRAKQAARDGRSSSHGQRDRYIDSAGRYLSSQRIGKPHTPSCNRSRCCRQQEGPTVL